MTMTPEQQLGWLAGVIDGEGSLTLGLVRSGARSGRAISNLARFEVHIANTDPLLLNAVMAIADANGMGYSFVQSHAVHSGWKQTHRVVFLGIPRVLTVLRAIQPYLVTKYGHATLLIRLAEHREKSKLPSGKRGYTSVLDDAVTVEGISQMKAINAIGGSSYPDRSTIPMDVRLAWLGGILEGEGCVTAQSIGSSIQWVVRVGATDAGMINELADVSNSIGVNYSLFTVPKKSEKHKEVFHWTVGSQDSVVRVLEASKEFLFCKRSRADLVLKMIEHRKTLSWDGGYINDPVIAESMTELRRLNQRGVNMAHDVIHGDPDPSSSASGRVVGGGSWRHPHPATGTDPDESVYQHAEGM